MVTRSNTRTIITEHAQEAVSNLRNFILLLLQFAKREREREREREEEEEEEEEEKGTHYRNREQSSFQLSKLIKNLCQTFDAGSQKHLIV